MSNQFVGTGNVGSAPELSKVQVGDKTRSVAKMRVFFDDYRPDGKGGFEQIGGFWLSVTAWGHVAENVHKHILKGTRVKVEGRLTQDSWTDKETGEEKSAINLTADDVTLSLSRLEQVQFKAKAEATESE